MPYINVGAHIKDEPPKSKKALKEALAKDPASVTFTPTSLFHTGPAEFTGTSLPVGSPLSVCGPDPHTDRKWFATVTATPRGIRVT